MKASRKRRRSRGGLTLVEVLLVLVILMIIASIAVTAYGPIQQKAYIKASKTQVEGFMQPLQLYRMDLGDFPSTNQGLEALRYPPSDLTDESKWQGPYLDRDVPLDPWGNQYQYEHPGKMQEDRPDIWSLGPDGVDGTDDDVGNWMQEE